ncbi:hypothetical protein BGZ79_004445, partial [Entomortierella chlamydospora]
MASAAPTLEQASTSGTHVFATVQQGSTSETGILPSYVLELNCIVEDESSSFPVRILSTEKVGILKNAIKEAKKAKLDMFDANELTLYKVSIPDEEKIVIESDIEMVRLAPSSMELWEKFGSVLPKKTIHVYVKPPQQDINVLDVISLIPPGVLYFHRPDRSPSTTTTRSVRRRTPTEVVSWDGFLDDVSQYAPSEESTFGKQYFEFDAGCRVSDEETL